MKINSAMRFIINRISSMSLRDAERFLSNNDFQLLATGCESHVYSRQGFDYVIKLQFNAHYNTSVHLDIPSDKHFMPMYVEQCNHFNVIIQQRVERLNTCNQIRNLQFIKFRKFLKKNFPKVSDIHDGNCGLLNGRIVAFDWCYDA